jgi:hypothetical protein
MSIEAEVYIQKNNILKNSILISFYKIQEQLNFMNKKQKNINDNLNIKYPIYFFNLSLLSNY